MNAPETPPIWRPLPAKLRAYEAVYWLNRSFEATLLSLERLEQLGIFRLEYLNEYKVRVEHTRAEANEELIDTLHEQEMDFGRRSRSKARHADNPIAYWTLMDPDSKRGFRVSSLESWRPRRDLNPCYRRERNAANRS